MKCLKCGRETSSEQIFCQDCLLDMEKYPVKPGTVVQLPKRRDGSSSRRNAKRRGVSLEDQVRSLKKKVRLLTFLLILALAIIASLAYPAGEYLFKDHFLPGQNYSSIVVTTAPTGVPAETVG
ncbi:MAG: hypothetical protein ACI4PO_09410 [Faecousia sp.]